MLVLLVHLHGTGQEKFNWRSVAPILQERAKDLFLRSLLMTPPHHSTG